MYELNDDGPIEILTLEGFRDRVVSGGVIAIYDDARQGSKVVVHDPRCPFVTEARFVEKVLTGGGRHGHYYWARSEHIAREQLGARVCGHPGDPLTRRADATRGGHPATVARTRSRGWEVAGPAQTRSVEAWTDSYVPFEPKDDELRELRRALREGLRRLVARPDEVLHAVFDGPLPPRTDVENALIYNMDQDGAVFAASSARGLRFELATRGHRPPPSGEERACAYQYRPIQRAKGPFFHWRLDRTLVRWPAHPVSATVLEDRASIWRVLRTAAIEDVGSPLAEGERFCTCLRVHRPVPVGFNAAEAVKRLFDGAVGALQLQGDMRDLDEIASRVGSRLRTEPSEIKESMTRSDRAVLGVRARLFNLRGNGFQLSPGDDLCVAGELLVDASPGRDWLLGGSVHAVRAAQ